MLTPEQIEQVQDSFEQVLPMTDAAADDFYRRLFAIAPDTRHLFNGDMIDQGRKLFLTLATVVDSLDGLDALLPVVRSLAVRHVGYGARPEHYAAVGEALIGMLRHQLGPRWNSGLEAAWGAAYGLLSGQMLDAAAAAAQPVRVGVR